MRFHSMYVYGSLSVFPYLAGTNIHLPAVFAGSSECQPFDN